MAADSISKAKATLIIIASIAAIGLSIYGIVEAYQAFQVPSEAQVARARSPQE